MSQRIILVECIAFILFILGLSFTGCQQDHSKDPLVKLDNIQRVFMNEPHAYTFFIEKKKETGELETQTVHNCGTNRLDRIPPRIFTDVPEGKPMHASYRISKGGEGSFDHDLEIHIHSVKDVEGGGWHRQEGKAIKKGQTNVIE